MKMRSSGNQKATPANKGKGAQQTPGQKKISAFFSPRASDAKTPLQNTAVKETPTPAAVIATPATNSKPQVDDTAVKAAPTPVTATPTPTAGPKQEVVGRRIRVFWADDDEWYEGIIKKYSSDDDKHEVHYDDGDVECVHLASEKYELLPDKPTAATPAAVNATLATPGNKDVDMKDLEDDDVAVDTKKGSLPDAAAGTKRRRLMSVGAAKAKSQSTGLSDSEEEDDAAESSGSEFEADGHDDSDDSVGLEDEVDDDQDADGSDDDEETSPAPGAKRKRSASNNKASGRATTSKRPSSATTGKGGKSLGKSAGPASGTPAPAAAGDSQQEVDRLPTTTPAATKTSGHFKSTPATAGRQLNANTPAPPSGARGRLQDSLGVKAVEDNKNKAEAVKDCVHGVQTKLSNEDAGRFLSRMAERFPFLHPKNIMDGNKRRPSDPDYDPSTLYIPPNWFKEMKISPGQQQWWHFKAQHFDSVLLFKMGKFYEMFEMDAYVGVDVLGLCFMKGDQPHAGFPEIRYHEMAESLARAGYRVVVVEQTETPEQLAKRNEERKRKGQKIEGVVQREKVAVVSKGTMIDAEMVSSKPDPSYVMAVYEQELPEDRPDPTQVTRIGLAAVDVATGHLVTGEFLDDEVRSSLRTHLTAFQPVELILPTKRRVVKQDSKDANGPEVAACPEPDEIGGPLLDGVTFKVLKTALRDPRVNLDRKLGWNPMAFLSIVGAAGYFSGDDGKDQQDNDHDRYRSRPLQEDIPTWPPPLRRIATRWINKYKPDIQVPTTVTSTQPDNDNGEDDGMNIDNNEKENGTNSAAEEVDGPSSQEVQEDSLVLDGDAALCALCGLWQFLKESMVAVAAFSQNKIEALPVLTRGSGSDQALGSDEPVHMLLNGAALENLEILENADGGSSGSLLSVLDHCATPFGRRRLRQWLMRPLYRVTDITRRQDAVATLSGVAGSAVGSARKALSGVCDLERAVARLFSSTLSGAEGRGAGNVVLYEDEAKRKVRTLTSAFKDLQAVCGAAQQLRAALDAALQQGGEDEAPAVPADAILRRLTNASKWGRVKECLDALEAAADWKQAEQTGRVIPAEGVNDDYDESQTEITRCEKQLSQYLKEVRSLAGRDVQYVSQNKDSHVMEIADGAKIPKDFTLVGQRKGFKKWMSPKLQELVTELHHVEDGREKALDRILQNLIERFCSERRLWSWAVDAVADLDALCSLASHAVSSDGPMCRPVIVDPAQGPAKLAATGLRHAAGLPGRCGAFVPNDILLGGEEHPSFIVLSGPNMGGKSTLLRQACLAAVLAQVGACVPADSMEITPVDAVFVRMGAKDHIMTGQSTFFVELAETAAMLNKATPRSLVALDELGRGTATLDGAAIASAVLHHMAHTVGCRGLFATHYHHLSKEHSGDPSIAIMHMACAVGGASEEDQAEDEDAAGRQQTDNDMDVDKDTKKASDDLEVPEVTFLYKLAPGACPKSYGTNVARLAGLPSHVVQRAAHISAATEGQIKDIVALRDSTAATIQVSQDGSRPEADMEVDGTPPESEQKATQSLISQIFMKSDGLEDADVKDEDVRAVMSAIQSLKDIINKDSMDVESKDKKSVKEVLFEAHSTVRRLCAGLA